MECLLTLNLTCFLCYGFYRRSPWQPKYAPSTYLHKSRSICMPLLSAHLLVIFQQLSSKCELNVLISVTIKMSTTQFWLLFTFLLITISLELALLIFKLDLWIQAWTLREQNLQEVLDLRQRWVRLTVVKMCITSSRCHKKRWKKATQCNIAWTNPLSKLFLRIYDSSRLSVISTWA